MAADGEGASKLFEAKVIGAKDKQDARVLSRAIVGSNLSKAAIYGCDANFGRFLCAMGYSGADFDQNDVELYFESAAGRLKVFDKGTPIVFDEDRALEIMKEDTVTVFVNMNEGEAMATGLNLIAEVLQVGHHGSKTSTSEEFLRAVAPMYAVISCKGSGRFKFPSPETTEKLDKCRVETYITGRDGAVTVELWPTGVKIKKESE